MNDTDPDLNKIKSFYDDVYYADTDKPLQDTAHLRNLANRMSVNRGDAVLDVACGLGEWLAVCQEQGATVAGVDLSDRAIAYCQEHLPHGDFHAVPAEKLPYNDATFDVVTCLGSLEHFVDPVVSLKEMVRVAKADARFLLLVPNADFLTRKLGLYGGTYQKDAKEVVRTLEEWERLFNEAGLAVTGKWKDLHVLSWSWIMMNGWFAAPLRAVQAMLLPLWPMRWQYQVYHVCETGAQK